jgi:hypothetical protein
VYVGVLLQQGVPIGPLGGTQKDLQEKEVSCCSQVGFGSAKYINAQVVLLNGEGK